MAWTCPHCSGSLIGIALLREGADHKAVGRFWSLLAIDAVEAVFEVICSLSS